MIPRAEHPESGLNANAAYFSIETEAVWRGTAWLAGARPLTPDSSDRLAGMAALDAAVAASGNRVTADERTETGHGPVFGLPCSVTCSDGHGAAVVHRDPDRRIGIDLERSGAVNPRFTDLFATRAERVLCPFGDPTVLWTLKEAASKALSVGDPVAFRDLEIAFTRHRHVRGVRVQGRETPVRCLVLLPWPGWILSVVYPEKRTG